MVLDYFELVINLLEIKQRRLKNLLACGYRRNLIYSPKGLRCTDYSHSFLIVLYKLETVTVFIKID